MHRITTLIILIAVCIGAYGQKKEIDQAKEYVKKGNNLDKAEQMMYKLLADSANKGNEKIWLTLFEAQKKQYDQVNEKLYLKQKADTSLLFQSAKRMFQTLEGLDSIDMLPDKKGNTKLVYRKRHAEYLNQYRRNLFSGGAYFINHGKFSEAYSFFDTYIDCARQPLFSEYKYHETDTLMPSAAYWAVYCGYKMQDPKATLHHTYMALKDTAHMQYMLQYLAETYKLEKDTARYVLTLEEGFDKYPHFTFFFPRLIEYYSSKGNLKRASELCDKALKADSTNTVFLFSKSSVLLSMNRYRETIDICKKLINRGDTTAGVFLNVGLAYFNQAVEMDKNAKLSAKQRAEIRKLYECARPYMERYRQMSPTEKSLWGLPLYTIYLNLNMGKEFEEIDKLMR